MFNFKRWMTRVLFGTKKQRWKRKLRVEMLEDRVTPSSTPYVTSIAYSNPVGQYTSAASVTYAVTFNQAVSGVAASDFEVVTGASAHASSPVVVSGSGSSYSVTVNGVHGNGTLQLDLINNDTINGMSSGSPPLGASFEGQI